MNKVAKLKLSLDPFGCGSIALDGMELDCISGIEFRAKAGEPTEIKLTIFAHIDAEVTARLESIALAKKQAAEPEAQTVRCADGREVRVRNGPR